MWTIAYLALVYLALVSVALAAPIPDGGSAYSGAGGNAVGGPNSKYTSSSGDGSGLGNNADVLNVASDNAGDGGKANSGDAFGGDATSRWAWDGAKWVPVSSNGGSAYTGVGGNANGGAISESNVESGHPHRNYWGWYENDAGTLNNVDAANIASGNAGDGGDASSGNAFGGDGA